MKRKKVGLYDPYFDTLGGGEKHVLSILQVLEREAAYDPVVFWDEDLSSQIESRLNLSFENLSFQKNIFEHGASVVEKLTTLRSFDSFIYVTNGSYFFSSAKRNYVFCMVPDRNLFTKTMLNWIKTLNATFITNSQFTAKWLKRWNITSEVLYPYINSEFIEAPVSPAKKEKLILVAGRFFEHLHSKRQDIAIEAYRKLRSIPGYEDYRLVLAGSVLPSDEAYLLTIRELAGNDPGIDIYPNISFTKLLNFYRKAKFYWHMTGYGVDDEITPEKVEHLGITPLEAMATGSLAFCYNAGGPKELIHHGQNGYLFDSVDHLIKLMAALKPHDLAEIPEKAYSYVRTNFSYDHFKRNVIGIFTT